MTNIHTSASPVSLSYVAALRGVKPRQPGKAFTYAVVDCHDTYQLIALAASNPEGQFYGFMRDAVACVTAWDHAKQCQVNNIRFASASPRDILTRFQDDKTFLPRLDYLVCNESERPLSALDRTALFDFATIALQPDGLFSISYRVNPDVESSLRFLVREFAPEMNAAQAVEFLVELKKLGKLYFAEHSQQAAKLEHAMQKGVPDEFFGLFDSAEARSATFDTIVAMTPRGFAYAGDAHIPSNYVELAVPSQAQALIVESRNNPLYEPIKDFTLNRTVRHDIWCHQTATRSNNAVDLFGSFSYGLVCQRDGIPVTFKAEGKEIALDSDLYTTLMDLMALIPVNIGDILLYPKCSAFKASEVVEAVQVLIACGLARPMRGISTITAEALSSVAQPRLAGNYNKYLEKILIQDNEMPMSSLVVGDVVNLSPRDALVMQALDRGGLANSVEALFPELQRLAKYPDRAQRIMHASEATPEIARQMVEDTVSQSIVQWYAYGLLQAA